MGLSSTAALVLTAGLTALLWEYNLSLWVGAAVLAALISNLVRSLHDYFWWPSLLPNLDSKAVLVTGCDSGFGLSLAVKLSGLGLPVYAGCLSVDSPGALQIKDLSSPRTHVIALDVTSDKQVEDAVKYVTETLQDSVLWAVVLNAGVSTFAEAELQPVESYRKVLDVNFLGVVRVCRAFLPLLRASKGRVVVTGSPLGRMWVPFASTYCCSKAAVAAFCGTLRREVARWGVSVHLVEPWLYRTKISEPDHLTQDLQRNFALCPQQVREDYGGEDYVTLVVEMMQRWVTRHFYKRPEAAAEVADEMLAACFEESPKDIHVPGFVVRLLINLFRMLPDPVSQVVFGAGNRGMTDIKVKLRRPAVYWN